MVSVLWPLYFMLQQSLESSEETFEEAKGRGWRWRWCWRRTPSGRFTRYCFAAWRKWKRWSNALICHSNCYTSNCISVLSDHLGGSTIQVCSRPLSLIFPLCAGAMSTGEGFGHPWGRNGESCVLVTYYEDCCHTGLSWSKALAVSLSHPCGGRVMLLLKREFNIMAKNEHLCWIKSIILRWLELFSGES